MLPRVVARSGIAAVAQLRIGALIAAGLEAHIRICIDVVVPGMAAIGVIAAVAKLCVGVNATATLK